jgi:hypothetical protein
MMKRRFAFLLPLVLCLAGAASAQSLHLTNADLDATLLQSDGQETPSLPEGDAPEAAPRRWWPLLASAAVPGLGELTTGHLRGIPMIAIDAAIWAGVYTKNKEGNDAEEDFEAFALEHWSEEEWANALAAGTLDPFFPEDDYGQGSTPDDVALYVSRDADEREWFENAGKWDQFAWGWREFWDDNWNALNHPDFIGPDFYAPQPGAGNSDTWFFADNPTMTPLRRQYIEMRDESNSAFETRDTLLSAALLLRVVSVLQMVYLEGFVGRRYDATDEMQLGMNQPQASWNATAAATGSGVVAWRMTW